MNAEEFRRQHRKLAREVDWTLLAAQARIDREARPAPVWTPRMVRTAVAAGFWCGVWATVAVELIRCAVSGWWLLLPLLMFIGTIGAAREDISTARLLRQVGTRVPRQRSGGDR